MRQCGPLWAHRSALRNVGWAWEKARRGQLLREEQWRQWLADYNWECWLVSYDDLRAHWKVFDISVNWPLPANSSLNCIIFSARRLSRTAGAVMGTVYLLTMSFCIILHIWYSVKKTQEKKITFMFSLKLQMTNKLVCVHDLLLERKMPTTISV